jgi:hypothetical protein
MLEYYDDIRELRNVGPKRLNDFNYWQSLLQSFRPGAEQAIRQAINTFVDGEVASHGWTNDCWFCSSFIPGSDWTGTAYQPYDAMRQRYGDEPTWNESRLFFGLLVKDVMIRRREHWICYKVPDKEEAEKGTNYFPDPSA